MKIHPLSALAGAGLLGLVLIAAGAVQVPGRAVAIPTLGLGPVQVAGIPPPQQMVIVKEGAPFVVPVGKLLAITGLGASQDLGANTLDVTLRVDGQDEVGASLRLGYEDSTVSDVPPGLAAPTGATVEVISSNGGYGRAWGYLVDLAATSPVVRVAGVPDPRSMLVVREGTSFVVPAGKLLAITAIGSAVPGQGALRIDGIRECIAASNWSLGSSCSVRLMPPGLTVHAGSSVEVEGSGLAGRAWGYLVDA